MALAYAVVATISLGGIIGQAISLAMVLFIAPFILSTKIAFLQVMAAISLIFAVIYPVRNVVTGLSSESHDHLDAGSRL